jgi:uncharacterized Zn finger protein (UPF0148 family)
MGKNKNINTMNIKGSTVSEVTNNLNKHGEIRGNNKNQTKNLRALCPHHKINKKGKLKMTIVNNGNGECTCLMCGRKFRTQLFDKKEVKDSVEDVREILDQARFMNIAADLGKETELYLAKVSVDISHLPKTYKRIRKATERTDSLKNKKKKSKKNYTPSYGGWR